MNATTNSQTIALTYRRVSTYQQERDGVSLEVQTDQCEKYVRTQSGWRLGDDFHDTMSGRRVSRPGYQAMLETVRSLRARGLQVAVVCAALDRMGRDLGESVRSRKELRQLNVPLHCIREGGVVQELQADVYASIAADESRRISSRVKGSQKNFRSKGWRSSTRFPWGYRLVKATEVQRLAGAPKAVLEIDPITAPYAREAWERAAAGETIKSIARWASSLPSSARGGCALWSANLLKHLKNPVYIARVEDPERGMVTEYATNAAGEQIVKRRRHVPMPDLVALSLTAGRWEPLVSDDMWVTVQQRLAGHVTMPRQAKGQYLLSGLLRCERCGMRLQGRASWGGTPHKAYNCHTPGVGCNRAVRADRIEEAVLEAVLAVLKPLNTNATLRAQLRREWAAIQKPAARSELARITAMEQTVARARRRQDDLLTLLVDKVIARDVYAARVEKEQTDIDAAERELADLRAVEAPVVLPPFDAVMELAGAWRTILLGEAVRTVREGLSEAAHDAMRAMQQAQDADVKEARQALAKGVPLAELKAQHEADNDARQREFTKARRDVLAELVVSVTPRRIGWGKVAADVAWTPLGAALAKLREAASAA